MLSSVWKLTRSTSSPFHGTKIQAEKGKEKIRDKTVYRAFTEGPPSALMNVEQGRAIPDRREIRTGIGKGCLPRRNGWKRVGAGAQGRAELHLPLRHFSLCITTAKMCVELLIIAFPEGWLTILPSDKSIESDDRARGEWRFGTQHPSLRPVASSFRAAGDERTEARDTEEYICVCVCVCVCV